MFKRFGFIIVIAALFLSSCSAARNITDSNSGAPQARPEVSGDGFEAPADNGMVSEDATGGQSSSIDFGMTAQRLVIQNAELTILVDAPGDAMSTIRRMADEMGGFVVTSNLYKAYRGEAGELPEATITVRVPAARLNEAIEQIKGLTRNPAEDVKAEAISGKDVTKEYTDLRSRLKNLEATEVQLNKIMDQATTTEDVLAVYQELTSIREQIEVIKGQIQYFEEAAALSSIAVLIQSKASLQPLKIGGWQPAGVARDSIQALIEALQGLVNILIGLVLFVLPLALILFFPIWIIWFFIRRARKNRKPPVQP